MLVIVRAALMGATLVCGSAAGWDGSTGASVPSPKNPPGRLSTSARRDSESVYCELPGVSTIKTLTPAGTIVKKGDLICELEPTGLRVLIAEREAVLELAAAELQNAVLSREAAELAVLENEAENIQERDRARSRVETATAELAIARANLEELKPDAPEASSLRTGLERDVKRAAETLSRMRKERAILETQTIPRSARTLTLELQTAKAAERERSAAVARARFARESLERRLLRSKIVAPVSGQLVYVRWRATLAEDRYAVVEKGARVVEGQALFRINPAGRGFSPNR
jgi:HlyD family secretion protein